jgi:short-subunit dehydrogenase
MKETAIVIGASSGLGRSLSQCLAQQGHNLILSSRNESNLTSLAKELELKFDISVKVLPVDLSKIDSANSNDYISQCFDGSALITQIYITAGMISNEDTGENSILTARKMFDVNFFGIAYLISNLAERLKNSKSNITIISSIASIRPRSQNISYSSSKIALEYFTLGLKHHYSANPINIQIYRMGYMDTAMTLGKKLLFPIAPTTKVAEYLYKHRGDNFEIRYYPRFWKLISILLSLLPWSFYKRLKF